MKERYRLRGARRAICRHSAHNVPSMPVGHVKTAPSITLHTGQGERDRQRETDRQAGTVRDGGRGRQREEQRSQCRYTQQAWGTAKRQEVQTGQ